MIVLAHLSDLHLDGRQCSTERASRVMAYLEDLVGPPDAVLVTGDIADHGLPAEYEQARGILSSRYRVLVCPGNHDERVGFRKVLLGQEPGTTPVNAVHRVAGATVAMCDSTIPGGDGGLLAEETLDWLDGVLAEEPDAPAFVCFHHPPVLLHSPFIDAIRQRGEHRLAEVVERHPNVVALLCGHAHTPAASTFAGRPLLVAPGVVSTLTLPWERGDALNFHLPPAVAFHVLDDNRRLTTHYHVVV